MTDHRLIFAERLLLLTAFACGSIAAVKLEPDHPVVQTGPPAELRIAGSRAAG